MSAPITEAHLELAKTALFSRDAAGRLYTAPMTAQLIADSEAKAILEMETGRIKKLVHAFQTEKQERARAELERDQLKAEVGHLHGRVGLFAKAHFGINDNLLTDETFAQMSHALQTERAGLAIEEENAIARAERAEAEVEHFKFLHQCESDSSVEAFARAERAELEVERLKSDGAASAFVNMASRASRAETDRNNLRADLDAIKEILNEENARAERAEAELAAAKLLLNEETDCAEAVEAAIVRQYARAERAEAEIKDRAAMMRDVMRERDAAEAELAAERARLDWLMAGGVVLIPNGSGFYSSSLYNKVSRAGIDSAMKEGK